MDYFYNKGHFSIKYSGQSERGRGEVDFYFFMYLNSSSLKYLTLLLFTSCTQKLLIYRLCLAKHVDVLYCTYYCY